MRSDPRDVVLFVPATLAGRVNEDILSKTLGTRVRLVSLAGHSAPGLAACVGVLGSTYDLTTRQQDVLSGMLIGDSNLEISEALGISLGTVKTHVEVILDKTGVRSRQRLGRLVFPDDQA